MVATKIWNRIRRNTGKKKSADEGDCPKTKRQNEYSWHLEIKTATKLKDNPPYIVL